MPAQPLTSTGPVDIAMAVKLALERSPSLAALRADVASARTVREEAALLRDPEFRMSYRNSETDTECRYLQAPGAAPGATPVRPTTADGQQAGAGVRFFPPNPWVRRNMAEEADANVRVTQADLRAAEWALIAGVRRLFCELYYLQNDEQRLGELAAVRNDAHNVMKEQSRQGQAIAVDVLAAAKMYLRAVADRNEASTRRADVARTLASLIGVEVTALAIETGKEPVPLVDPGALDAMELEQCTLRNRAELESVRQQAVAAGASYGQARSNRIPWPSFVEGSYVDAVRREKAPENWAAGLAAAPQDALRLDEDSEAEWRIDAAIQIPVFSARGNTAAARLAEWKQKQLSVNDVTKQIILEVNNAFQSLGTAVQNAKRYAEEAAPIVDEMKQLLKDIEGRPDLSPNDVATTKEQIIISERLRLRSLFEYHMAFISLEEAAGSSLDAFFATPAK